MINITQSEIAKLGKWVEYNENPTKKKITKGRNKGKYIVKCDCVVRAFMQAWGVDWYTAAKRLFERALEVCDMPDSSDCYTTFLKPSNISPLLKLSYGRRYITVKEFAGSTRHSYQGYIVKCPHHLVFVKHGKYFDAWDSGEMNCRKIWVLK